MSAIAERLTLRPFAVDELDGVHDFISTAFHQGGRDDRDHEISVFEAERGVGAYDGDRLTGTAGIYTRTMTLPGGPQPVACVTGVSVATEYTRQGVLTRMMRHQLTELHEGQAEPVAALWASESGIYGRFGYGLAARHANLTANTRELRFRRPIAGADRRVRVRPASDPAVQPELTAVYDGFRNTAVGHLDRRDRWWEFQLYDPERDRKGATELRAAIHDGPDGPDGYALFSVKPNWRDDGPFGTLQLREFVARNAAAEAALWAFLFSQDLVGEVTGRIAPDSALPMLVDHPRRVRMTLGDNLWVRLADVGQALAARAYAAPIDVVLDVTDEFCPWNAGRWRLAAGADGATCERTTSAPDLAVTSTALGAAYLGGVGLAALARAGAVTELHDGALRPAAIAFAEIRAPYCPEIF